MNEVREAHRMLALLSIRSYYTRMRAAGITTTIELADEPSIDEYGTVTLGTWKGYAIQVMPMLFNDRLVMTPLAAWGTYDYAWCFDKGGAAYLAAAIWDPETQAEPPGYKKRVCGLRQPGEDADTEWPVGVRNVMNRFAVLPDLNPLTD